MSPTLALLHGSVSTDAAADDLDTLVQVQAIGAALERLGWSTATVEYDGDDAAARRRLSELNPVAVFNLVESIHGVAADAWRAAGIPESLGLPCSGSSSAVLRATTCKLAMKQRLAAAALPTPAWLDGNTRGGGRHDTSRWIVKSDSEHASRGIDDASVVTGAGLARTRVAEKRRADGGDWFAERFVEGREFNLSLLDGPDGPEALPVAELLFDNFPAGKPRIVGYTAKWDESSFEYHHTRRGFDCAPQDRALHAQLKELALRCWGLFDLSGYARVDFRVDDNGRPWILEINTNPCLSPDAGLAAAAGHAGLDYDRLIERIVTVAIDQPRATGAPCSASARS